MDPTEIIKAVPEMAKTVAPLAAAIPFTGIVKRMLGPAADELAEMWRDKIRLYRYDRQIRCIEKAESMAKAAGFTPNAVPSKILFPLLEGVSFENEESLHDMWAALLVNAASPYDAERVRPSFIATLKQMSPDEASILSWMHEQTWTADGDSTFSLRAIFKIYGERGFLAPTIDSGDVRRHLAANLRLGACLDSLESAALIRAEGNYENRVYKLTTRGDQLIYVCRPPKPRS